MLVFPADVHFTRHVSRGDIRRRWMSMHGLRGTDMERDQPRLLRKQRTDRSMVVHEWTMVPIVLGKAQYL